MQELEDATIVYLDDQLQSLSETTNTFKERGIKLKTTQSIDEAKSYALRKDIDILICDLHLDEIDSKFRGSNILRLIRAKRKDIFLALYTAYKNELSKDELDVLTASDIFVYDKEDNVEFILNLVADYNQFRNKGLRYTASSNDLFDINVSNSIVDKVIIHLKGITNQDLLVPVPGFEDITVNKLIEEVFNKTPRAEAYVKLWFETKLIIKEYRIQ
jgi:response regulator RpfG family c-di-GMP phosphodiesterase